MAYRGITRHYARNAARLAVGALILTFAAIVPFGLARADATNASASVTREAYFTYPITQTTPPFLRNGFPPATACLVAGLAGVPQVCGDAAQQAAALLGLTDGIPVPVTPDGDLAQPIVVPGTTPVGMFGGQTRYVSLQALSLPPLGDGERFGKFELVLHQDGANFAIESPALRNLVLQTLSQVEAQDPEQVAKAVVAALSGEVPLADDVLTGIEVCPVIDPWNAGRAQGAALDGTRVPRATCLSGSTGVYDAAAKTWTFDITFAVQAWTEGTDGAALPNQGLLFRPLGAPNLAYGDPDFSTNWLVSLADSTNSDATLRPRIRYTTVVDDAALVVDPGGAVDFPDASLSDSLGDAGDLGTSLGDIGAGANPPRLDVPTARVAGSQRNASTPAWVWLALPLVLGVGFVFEQSLAATPDALRRRPGALTKLVAAREEARSNGRND